MNEILHISMGEFLFIVWAFTLAAFIMGLFLHALFPMIIQHEWGHKPMFDDEERMVEEDMYPGMKAIVLKNKREHAKN